MYIALPEATISDFHWLFVCVGLLFDGGLLIATLKTLWQHKVTFLDTEWLKYNFKCLAATILTNNVNASDK